MTNPGKLRQAVLRYAQDRKGQTVGRGECWDLANEALTVGAGAKSAGDYGTVTPTSDDRWGQRETLEGALPGDVLQFKDHKAILKRTKKTKITFPDGAQLVYKEVTSRKLSRGHHTAIVVSSLTNGVIIVLEQHVDRGRGRGVENTVDEGTIYVKSRNTGARKTRERFQITPAWGREVKLLGTEVHKAVDGVVKAYNGTVVDADVETTETISVTGTIKAYTPQSKK